MTEPVLDMNWLHPQLRAPPIACHPNNITQCHGCHREGALAQAQHAHLNSPMPAAVCDAVAEPEQSEL